LTWRSRDLLWLLPCRLRRKKLNSCADAKPANFYLNWQTVYIGKTLSDYIMVFVTCRDKSEAEKISQQLVKEKLIACANIVGPVKSYFHWKGEVDVAEEFLIVMKSRKDLFERVSEHVKRLHSYEVPEVLAIPVVDGSKAYLDWMRIVLELKA